MKRITTLLAASLCGVALAYGCSSSSNGSAPGGGDGGPDATADVSHKDAAPQGDDSGDDASSSTCPMPADLSTWQPPGYVPAKNMPGACTATDLSGYDAACLNTTTASKTACMTFQIANPTCAGCLMSKSTDSSWGPLISWGGVVNVNLGGCLQLVAPAESACALAQEVAMACPHAACDTVCPVTSGDMASFTQWQDCEMTAVADACGVYEAPANCLATDDAAAGTVCDPSSSATFEGLFMQIAPLFCGGGEAGAMEGGPGEAGPAEGGAGESGADSAAE